MPTRHIESTLNDGFVDTWLVAGPVAREVRDLERFGTGPDYKLRIARDRYDAEPGLGAPPVERGGLAEGVDALWQYRRCADDHFVDLTGFYHLCHHLSAWAYAELQCPEAAETRFELTTNGPADVWLNGARVCRTEAFSHQIPATVAFSAPLREGGNALLVRFEAVAVRECPFVMALRLAEPALAALPVRLPTETSLAHRYADYERVFAQASLDREVYARGEEIVVRWPPDMRGSASVAVRLQTPDGRIFVEALVEARAGVAQSLGKGVQYPDGPLHVALLPHPDTYYIHNLRVSRALPLYVLKGGFSDAPYGAYEERRLEALRHAADQPGVYAQIARMELGRWSALDVVELEDAVEGINRRRDCSDFYLVGLLGALLRYGDEPRFPSSLRRQLETCAAGFRYWMDEPGDDAMCFWSENHQILFHACEVLAGQLFADHTFSNDGRIGAQHRATGEARALAWLRKRAAGGFREWDSNVYFEHDALALAHLADLAASDELRELSAVVLDKLLFTLALNSFRGAFGSTHGRTYSRFTRDAALECTSGMGRLLWGTGAYNAEILGPVALACARGYELPPVITEIAAAPVEELWSKERHAGEMEQGIDRAEGAWEVNKVTYKTPDGMLCSAQSYRPGEPGVQQHIWQATLSHDAVIFVTQPPCVSDDPSHRPSFWAGNVTLPRVAQWRDTLIAVHNIPEGDWFALTHAFFPTAAFDEFTVRDGHAFARKDDGYVALAAAQGLELTREGPGARRELRSRGRQNVWVCRLGRAARDGDFAAFQAKVLAAPPRFEALGATVTSLAGEEIRFGWEGPLLVNGAEQPLAGFKHYESPLCTCELDAPHMDIAGWNDVLRLQFR
jgi:hypothetical protein